MKTQKINKKLSLHKSTISQLTDRELVEVQGGMPPSTSVITPCAETQDGTCVYCVTFPFC